LFGRSTWGCGGIRLFLEHPEVRKRRNFRLGDPL